MFGFLKGKTKGKGSSTSEVRAKSSSKESSRKHKKDNKERQKVKQNDGKDESQSANTYFKKSNTLSPQALKQGNGKGKGKNFSNKLSNSASNVSCNSLDQNSCSENTYSASEASELNSKSSSCLNSYTVSNSSSRASIPSITTESIDDRPTSQSNTQAHVSCKPTDPLNQGKATSHNPVHQQPPRVNPKIIIQTNSPVLDRESPANEQRKKAHLSTGLAMKPPLNPRVTANKGDHSPPIARAMSNEDEDTSVSSSVYSAPPSPLPKSVSPSRGISTSSRPTSPDGRTSMLSTPSSSTSSLSSLSVRPTSPSGRKTPPGPKMGTNVKLGTSPTATRKGSRTNIKTNPKASSNLSRPTSPPVAPIENIPTHLPTEKRVESAFVFPKINDTEMRNDRDIPLRYDALNGIIPNENIVKDSMKEIPCGAAKPRHSVTSMHSLESIPENENDNQVNDGDSNEISNPDSNEKSTFTKEKDAWKQKPSTSTLPLVCEEPAIDILPSPLNENEQKPDMNSAPQSSGTPDDSSETSSSIIHTSTRDALCNLRRTIEKEKQFANSIMKDYIEYRNDDDSSESLREPEIKEHKLELIPNSVDMRDNMIFTTDKMPLQKVDEKGKCKSDSNLIEENSDKTTNDPVSNSDPESTSSISPHNVEPTHVVFQIPLRSKSCSRERTESPKRVSTERDTLQHSNNNVNPNSETIPSYINPIPPSMSVTVEALNASPECEEDTSAVHCVEGHVELNFDRGRSDQRTPKVPRRRSSSSARRQKLYDDIKKYTAQTKEMQLKGPRNESPRRSKPSLSRQSSREESEPGVGLPSRGNNLTEVSKKLWGEDGKRSMSLTDPKSVRPRSVSSSRNSSNTLPRTSPKRLERSITVAEIKVNVNNNNTLPLAKNTIEVADEIHENATNEMVEAKYDAMGVSPPAVEEPVPMRPKRTKTLNRPRAEKNKRLVEQIYENVTPLTIPTTGTVSEQCRKQEDTSAKSKFAETDLVSEPENDIDLNTKTNNDPTNSSIQEDEGAVQATYPGTQSDVLPSSCTIYGRGSSPPVNGYWFENDDEAEKNEDQKESEQVVVIGGTELLERVDGANGTIADARPEDEVETKTVSVETHQKELSSLEAKYKDQVDQLTKALALKQEELKKSKEEAEKILKQSEERSKREQEELKEKLEKDKAEIEERHRKEQEEREQREHEAAKLQNDTKEADEKSSSPTHEEEDKDEEEEEESEAECNKRKLSSLQTEILLLKQQNDEFEEMVREKHRRQIELELQIVEMGRDVTAKEATAESVKVELCYSKNEQELMRARTKRMEEEITELKERIESLEQELDTSERELKRMEILQEKLQITEAKRNELQTQLDEVEVERDEEIKIIQDALDEAAQEREELLITFEKEIENLNSLNAAREAQMLEDFEAKLKELEQQHKAKLEERERLSEAPLHRGKRQPDEEETRQRLDKMKSELNSEWEDKLRSECSRLKGELDNLHAEEKHLAVESIKVQKEQELQNLKKTFETKAEDMNKEIATLKESLATKDAFYHKELDDMRTRADRDIWELRRKLQKLDESSYDRQQYLEDKHRDDIERLREDYADKMASMESQLSVLDVRGMVDMRAQLEKIHKEQMEHIGEQHTLSMERLRDELEAEKFQAAEEARVIVTKHHEYINNTLREQLTEALTANTQYRDEIEAIRFALSRREEVIRSLEEDLAKLRSSKGVTPPNAGYSSSPTSIGGAIGGGGVSPPSSTSQFSHEGSQGSRSSQDRLSTEGPDEDGHKGSGLLGKVFGGGWFSGPKTKDNTSPGYSNTTVPAKKSKPST